MREEYRACKYRKKHNPNDDTKGGGMESMIVVVAMAQGE